MKTDFVAELVALARETPPERLETVVRSRFGGQVVRITAAPPRPALTIEDVDSRLRQRMPVTAIAADLGVSRTTIYRLLWNGKGPKRRA
jgi:DNA invertase Pin-like site-specific DNA recombinase